MRRSRRRTISAALGILRRRHSRRPDDLDHRAPQRTAHAIAMRRSLTIAGLLAFGGALALIAPARATVLADTSFSALVGVSDLVVIARVGHREVVEAPPGALSRYEVHTELSIERALRGSPRARETLRQLGEGDCTRGERVADDACLREGSRVLLFLRSGESRFVHLALLGFSAFDLVADRSGVLAVPHARLEAEASGPELRVGQIVPFAAVERALGPITRVPTGSTGGTSRPGFDR